MRSTPRSSPSSRMPSRTSVTPAQSCSRARGRRSAPARTSSGSARRSTCPTRRTSPTRCACTGCSTRSTPARRPVVCCVHGFALGGGCGLVACADVAIALAGRGVRVHGGTARDHPGRDLAVRAAEDRRGRAALLRHRRALRRGGRAEDRARVGDLGGRRRTRRVDPPRHPRRRPDRRPRGEAARARAARRRGDRRDIAAARRTSDEGQDGLRAFLERRSAGWLEPS